MSGFGVIKKGAFEGYTDDWRQATKPKEFLNSRES